MKKLLPLIAVILLAVVSCGKLEVGGTATQEFAGQWSVVCYAVDENGEVLYEDPFDELLDGTLMALTYNTMQDYPDSIFVQCSSYFKFKALVHVNSEGKFGEAADKDLENLAVTSGTVKIWDGEILKGAAKTPSGMPADSIRFNCLASSDTYAGTVYDHLVFAGYRYTGFAADEP